MRRSLSDEEYRLHVLAESDRTEYGRAIFGVVKSLLERYQKEYNEKAIVSDTEVKRDFRYLRGMVNAFQKVLNIPQDARDKLKREQ